MEDRHTQSPAGPSPAGVGIADDESRPSPTRLETAFARYRAGSYSEALASLRSLLLTAARERGGSHLTLGDPVRELSTRALTFIGEIGRNPTRRETAAALMMVGTLVGDATV